MRRQVFEMMRSGQSHLRVESIDDLGQLLSSLVATHEGAEGKVPIVKSGEKGNEEDADSDENEGGDGYPAPAVRTTEALTREQHRELQREMVNMILWWISLLLH